MATHDYIISNGTGAAVRSDLNNALAAIVSNNSNSSEPATKYAYQWWADTSNAVMKIRNSANDGWIELFQLDGTITLEDGSASTPALANRGDLDTGVFFGGANEFNIATAGTERFVINANGRCGIGATDASTAQLVVYRQTVNSGNPVLEVRSNHDTTNSVKFSIDGDGEAFFSDRVGIGNSSPAAIVHIASAADDDFQGLRIINTKANASAPDSTFIRLGITNAGGEKVCSIKALQESNTGNAVALVFSTNNSGGNNSETEQFRISSEGKAGIGTDLSATPSSVLTVKPHTSGGRNISLYTEGSVGNKAGIFFNKTQGTGNLAEIQAEVESGDNEGSLIFSTSLSSRLVIDKTGQIGIAESSPVTWNSAYISLQMFDAAVFYGSNDDSFFGLGANHYLNTSGNFLYVNSDFASRMFSVDGTFEFHTAPSGTAGAALTFTRRVKIGNLGHQTFNSDDTSNASLTLKKNVSGADTIDYLQCRDSSNDLKMKVGGNGGISNFQSNDSNLSDETMKKNIVDCESIIEKFKQWKLRKFNYNTETDGTPLTYGVIAQEVETLHSDLVNADFPVDDGNGNEVMKKSVKDHQLMMLSFKALQEAIAKIEVLETKVAALEAA